MSTACCDALSTKDDVIRANRRMTLDDMIAQREALLAAPFPGVRTSQRSTLSSTISARNLPCSAVMRPTVMGRRKRRGPALPGLKKGVPFFSLDLGLVRMTVDYRVDVVGGLGG